MKLFGAAQTLESIQENARAGQFDALQRLLDAPLGNGGQKSGLGHGRFEPAALVTKVQMGKLDRRGRQRGQARKSEFESVHLQSVLVRARSFKPLSQRPPLRIAFRLYPANRLGHSRFVSHP